MRDILKQVNAVPGTIGSMICDEQGQLLAHAFPPLFDKSMLNATATIVSDNIPGLEEMTGGVRLADFRFQDGRIVVKPVDGGCLVLLCSSTINLQLLTISLNVVLAKLDKLLKSGSGSVQSVVTEAPPSSGSLLSAQEHLENGPLSTQLQGIQASLAKFLGPMAKIIFRECVEKWLLSHPPTKATLPQLINIVVLEIDDPPKVADFRQRVAQFM